MAEINPRTELLTGHTNQPDQVWTDAVFSVKVDATAGEFILTVNGTDTADIAFDAAASAVKDAIVATDEVEADQVSVTGGPGNAGGTNPYVITISDLEGNQDAPTLAAADGTTPLSGGSAAVTVTVVTEPHIQAIHQTTVITDPSSQDAVQTPIAQQTGGLDAQGEPSPADVYGD